MDDAEHRRAGADADGENQDGGRGEAPIAAQPPDGVTQILGQHIEPNPEHRDDLCRVRTPGRQLSYPQQIEVTHGPICFRM